jgi:hypothetical protein
MAQVMDDAVCGAARRHAGCTPGYVVGKKSVGERFRYRQPDATGDPCDPGVLE